MRLLSAASLILSPAVFGQTYTISTVAGGGLPPDNIVSTSAVLDFVQGVALDASGDVFLVSGDFVFRLNQKAGTLSRIAGVGTPGFSGDNGPATSAKLRGPTGVAVDSAGSLYIADRGNNRIRKVSNGVITTVAGNGSQRFNGDNGPATSAQLDPSGIALDSTGNLYIADFYNHRIRKVSKGVITTVAGNGTGGFSGDTGPATGAQLSYPFGVAVDSAGDLYIAGSRRVRKVSNGVITTVAGNEVSGFSGDNGPATGAQFKGPDGVAVDSFGDLYIADSGNNRVRKVSNGVITTVAGNGPEGFSGDNGPATSARLNTPHGVAVDSAGNLYIADMFNYRMRKVSKGVITTVVGNGSQRNNGPATSAQLNSPRDVAVDAAGNLYIGDGDLLNKRIRWVLNGVMTTMVEVGSHVAVDSAGNFYSADSVRIRKFSNKGGFIAVAGIGTPGFSGDDGPATSAQLRSPQGVAVDAAGNLYIADFGNHRVRKVSKGVITTVAGNGMNGFSGDNGPATSAMLSYPHNVAVDSAGNLYITDFGHRIRKVSKGVITTVAGSGMGGFSGDNGPATTARLNTPYGVAVDSAGSLYIADSGNHRIRKVSNGVITTVAGSGTPGFSGDKGPATGAQLAYPTGIAVDSTGNVYIADGGNNRVRVLTPAVTAKR